MATPCWICNVCTDEVIEDIEIDPRDNKIKCCHTCQTVIDDTVYAITPKQTPEEEGTDLFSGLVLDQAQLDAEGSEDILEDDIELIELDQ